VAWSNITSPPQNIVDLSAMTANDNDIIQKKSGVITNRSISQLKTDLNIGNPIEKAPTDYPAEVADVGKLWMRTDLSTPTIKTVVQTTTSSPDSNTKLLLHCEGDNDSTVVVDAVGTHTITCEGNTKLKTAQSKFGASSLYMDGTGDYITIPYHTDFNFDVNDFTIECFFRPSDKNYDFSLFNMYEDASNFFQIYFQSNSGQFAMYVQGGGIVDTYGASTITNNEWHHIAAVRYGNYIYLYINGTRIKNYSYGAGSLTNGVVAPIKIGYGNYTGESLNGYLDEYRVSDVARYINDTYDVPATAFGTGSTVYTVKTLTLT
jgi:hypothetical protein